MKINGYWVATETEATDANGAHVSPRDWQRQESGMTLKVKRKKKNLKKKGRGGEMRTGGWESVSELKERREKGGRERKRRWGRRRRKRGGRAWMLEGEIKLVSFTSHFCPLPLNRVKGPLKNEELGLSSKNP